MKKHFIFSLLIFTFYSHSVHADSQKKHELYIGMGAWNPQYIEKKGNKWLDATIDDKWFGDDGSSIHNNGLESYAIKKIGYSYRIKDNLLVTLSATSQKHQEDHKTGMVKAWLLGARHEYSPSATGCVYSGISIGQATEKYQTTTADTKTTSTAFQLDVLGLKYSKDALSAYASVGVGQEGFLQGGLSLGF